MGIANSPSIGINIRTKEAKRPGMLNGKMISLKIANFPAPRSLAASIVEESIPHDIYAKFGPARVLLRPQQKGRGLVAGGVVRVICDLGGIKNISSKIVGRTGNKLNNANATIEALKKLRKPNEKRK